ncbi:hypothetical protein RGR602_PC02006 (plasmid) [Rhizobium gallicum bv. gallicum R602sp]|uniref:Uncharacterized protein n=1 Tax=Rhizobium gallicum bv. gallicum R602sp TaxID=1041138 RepID=A0A0B4XDG6_9HYPH|nr:hypothetical protein RGR602_PC02006 [Rhizobium gallicum bv. gallicum R602sp]
MGVLVAACAFRSPRLVADEADLFMLPVARDLAVSAGPHAAPAALAAARRIQEQPAATGQERTLRAAR